MLTSPEEKACQSAEKSCFIFWNDNCRPNCVADFAGSKFQRMANWPSFDFFSETEGELHETGRLFRIILRFDFLIETGPVGHPLEFEPAKSANPTIE